MSTETEVVDYPEPTAPTPTRQRIGMVLAGVLAAGALSGFLGPMIPTERAVDGTAMASPVEVTRYLADEKVAAEAQATADKKAADAAFITTLEADIKGFLQEDLNDPVKGLITPYGTINVLQVGVVKTGDNTYEGMATMQVGGFQEHDVPVHITADERWTNYSIDKGAMAVLFR